MEVLFEDNHLIAVNKPAGWLVQGDNTGDTPLAERVKQYIKEKYRKPGEVFLGVIHRLDRPVSGVVLFARTSKALERMNQQFRERETQKTYRAVVERKPGKPEDTLIHWLRKDESKNKTAWFTRETPDALRSELSYSILEEANGFYLLDVRPVTGRPHQIRVQLAAIGCPIVGDLRYGAPSALDDARIALHARSLTFIHPVSKAATAINAPLPDHSVWNQFTSFAR
ncbi:MAG TPA: RNA pseudouridine synthase [Cytophagales bacterium]|nr:RNA pseudouridine synthase [Cytophagales bacterium]